jgi:hypothetical protein
MLYLYGITDESLSDRLAELKGIGNPPEPVTSIQVGHYHVIISELDRTRHFGPGDAAAHSRVLECIGESPAVIPIRLGTVADNIQDLTEVVNANRASLDDLINRFTGRVEVGIKIYWNENLLRQAMSKLVDLDKARLDSSKNPAQAHDIAVEIGQMAERITNSWREEIISKAIRLLRPMADDMAMGQLTSIYMLCNVSFLISRRHGEAFRTLVYQLGDEVGEEFQIHYVENLPPFSFANITLGRNDHGGNIS